MVQNSKSLAPTAKHLESFMLCHILQQALKERDPELWVYLYDHTQAWKLRATCVHFE